MAPATAASPKTSSQHLEAMLEVMMTEARSSRTETSWKNKLAASALEWNVVDLVDGQLGDAPEPGELGAQPALSVGLAQAGHPLRSHKVTTSPGSCRVRTQSARIA